MGFSKWYQNAIFYEINTRTFYDSNNDGIGDLKGITLKLDYIKSLGVDCIWLLPIYPSPLKDGGYDISDFYDIHPDLGTIDDFKKLVDETHKHGMHIIADLVVNHTSDQCEWFLEAQTDKISPYHDYYVWSETDQKYQDARIIFVDTEKSNWSWNEKAGKYYWHRFYTCQPDLNYDNPAVQEEMKNIMRFWLDMGIDGFRADAVPYLYQREGTNCENLPETHAYLKELRQLIDQEYPECILLAEANQWPHDLRPYLGDGDEFHMAFHFPLMPRIYMSVALGDGTSIMEIMEKTPAIPENCQWCTFLRNHDELTLEMVTDAERKFMWEKYAPDDRMRLNLGIRRRLAPLMDGNINKIELLYAILFSLPGTPIIYYGDEIGMGDNIWLNDRDGVRTPMQWSDDINAGFSAADSNRLFLPVIDKGDFSFHHINVASQADKQDSLINRLKQLIKIRKEFNFLSSQSYEFINRENVGVLSILRWNETHSLLCFHNLTAKAQEVNIGEEDYVLIHSSPGMKLNINPLDELFSLPAYAYAWIKLRR